MTATIPRQTAPIVEKAGPFDLGILVPSRTGAALAWLLGFLTFMPYPAIPIGRNSALQAGNILTLLMVLPSLALAWRRRPFLFYPMLLLPLVLSALKVALVGDGTVELCLKATPLWALSLLTMVAVQLYAPRYGLHLMLGIAMAAVIHVAVGMWQLHGFSTGQLPLTELYINPSFLTVQDRAKIIARYIQRPFGLFPEPSAMSSCLAPWVLLWLANVSGLVRFNRETKTWHRALFAVAALGGLLLIVLSRSGHAVFVVAGAAVLFLVWLKNSSSSARTYAVLVLVAGVALPALVWLTFTAMQERAKDAVVGNDSWADRATSLVLGFQLLVRRGGGSLVFGLGSGQTADMLWNLTGLEAVWSVLLTYVYETGLVGAMVVSWIGWHLFGHWRATRAKMVYAMVAGVWLVGITITTSYQQLLPLWVFLGWLTVWPQVCDGPGQPKPRAAVSSGQPFIPVRNFPRRTDLIVARPKASARRTTGAIP